MAAVEKRSGSYSARVSLTDPDTGARTQKRITARTKRELDAKVAELKAEWNRGNYIDLDTTPLRDYLAAWLPKAGGTEATMLNRDQHFRVHIEQDRIGSIPIGRLRLAHLQDFVDRKVAAGFKPSYIKLVVNIISHAMNRAVRLGMVRANPCVGLDYPKIAGSDDALKVYSEAEARTLAAGVAHEDDAAFWTLAVTIGLRRGELIALRWEEIDFERGTLTVNRTQTRNTQRKWIIADAPKSDTSRHTIPLPAICLSTLRRHRTRQLERRLALGAAWQDTGAVFDAGDGTHYTSPDRIDRRWIKLRAVLGLPPLKLHALRHSAATNALIRGMPVHVVAKMLGHSDPSITLRIYAHVLPDVEREAIARIDALYA